MNTFRRNGDLGRGDEFTVTVGDLYIDYSKRRIASGWQKAVAISSRRATGRG
ncbi:MAG: hypothetical protein WB777_26405 [Mycobacterium sp.]